MEANAPRALELANGRSLLRSDGLPLLMGIVNITPDSFSDGGEFLDPDAAVGQALALIEQGADLIDLGAESSRPGAEPLSHGEEWGRLAPVLQGLRKQSDVPISIDTYHAETARLALDAGADLINDITGARFDSAMLALAAERDVPLCLMHMLGDPQTMQSSPRYADVAREVKLFLKQRCDVAKRSGVDAKRLIVDPGFGFGKTVEHNVALVQRLGELRELGLVLMGLSRKSSLVKLSVAAYPESYVREVREDASRRPESIAGALMSALNGADILRVHDVGPTVRALRVGLAMR